MKLALETDRLLLREVTEEDFNFIIKLETRPENQKYEMEGIPKKDNVIEACKWFVEKAKILPECGAIKYIVCDDKGNMIGTVSLICNWEKTKEWEIGYMREARLVDGKWNDELVFALLETDLENEMYV